jgi:phosphoribosylglycinamide formyltransferase-1
VGVYGKEPWRLSGDIGDNAKLSDPARLSIAAMVSAQGRGSNLAALLDACHAGQINGQVSVVIGTRTEAPALDRARSAGVPVAVVSPRKYEQDEAGYARVLLRLLDKYDVRLICLAGYMRKLPSAVVSAFPGAIMNVHPALLPFFGGQGMYGENVHRAVLASGMKVTGCTIHFVDEQYDTGPIIVQNVAPVLEDDTTASLAKRVLDEEHAAYVRAVQLFAEGRLRIEGKRVCVLPHEERGVII